MQVDFLYKQNDTNFISKDIRILRRHRFPELSQQSVRIWRSVRFFRRRIGTNRKFAMSAVNEYGKLYACGSSACKCRIQGSPCRAARIKNIIDKNHIHTINTKRNIASGNHRIGLNFAQVVTIERDIKLAYGNGYPLDCFYVFARACARGTPLRLIPSKTICSAP